MSAFLLTTRHIGYPAIHTLNRIAQKHGCTFHRVKGSGTMLVRGWFDGPGLSDSAEAARKAAIVSALKDAGISYPEYDG